jgi:hypothetical protein
VNHRIATVDMREEMLAERRERLGITDLTYTNAVDVNNLDDWQAFHDMLVDAE